MKKGNIEVSIRMRPLLKDLEDEEGWLIDD